MKQISLLLVGRKTENPEVVKLTEVDKGFVSSKFLLKA